MGIRILKYLFDDPVAEHLNMVVTKESDVDVVVQLAKPNLLVLSALQQELQESLKIHVDVIRLRETMNPFLKDQISQEAIYV